MWFKTRSPRERRVVHPLLALIMLVIGLLGPMTAYAAPTPSAADTPSATPEPDGQETETANDAPEPSDTPPADEPTAQPSPTADEPTAQPSPTAEEPNPSADPSRSSDVTASPSASDNPSDWSCVDANAVPAPVNDGAVGISPGQDVTCTIVNDDLPPSWSILKISDPEPGATVQPGDEITYAVGLIRNDGVDPRDVVVNDDLSQVLNNATLVDGPFASTGTAVITGNTLTWNVSVLSEELEIVLYTVRVNDDAVGVTLKNQAASPGSSPCVEDGTDVLADASRAVRTSAAGAAMARISSNALTAITAAADDDLCPTTTEHTTPPEPTEPTEPTEPGEPTEPSEPNQPNLANTGGPGLASIGIGLVLLAVGGGVMLWSRRRKTE